MYPYNLTLISHFFSSNSELTPPSFSPYPHSDTPSPSAQSLISAHAVSQSHFIFLVFFFFFLTRFKTFNFLGFDTVARVSLILRFFAVALEELFDGHVGFADFFVASEFLLRLDLHDESEAVLLRCVDV